MIRILGRDDSPVRIFPSQETGEIHFFERFGFVSAQALASRRRMRQASGTFTPDESDVFRLHVQQSNNGLFVEGVGSVETLAIDSLRWQIRSFDNIYLATNVAVYNFLVGHPLI